MIQENELICLILLSAVLLFAFFSRKELSKFPGFGYFYSALILMYISVIFTIAEGFALAELLNFLEHFFKVAGSAVIFLWTLLLFKNKERSE